MLWKKKQNMNLKKQEVENILDQEKKTCKEIPLQNLLLKAQTNTLKDNKTRIFLLKIQLLLLLTKKLMQLHQAVEDNLHLIMLLLLLKDKEVSNNRHDAKLKVIRKHIQENLIIWVKEMH